MVTFQWFSFRRLSLIIGAVIFGTASIVLLGWFVQNATIKRIFPDMSPLSTLTFILVSATILLLNLQTRRTIPRVFVGFIVLIGVLRLGEVAFGIQTGMDRLFVSNFGASPTLMSPNTAVAFILMAGALLPNDISWQPRIVVGQMCALLVVLIATTAIAGHIYGLSSLYTVNSHTAMSLNSACLLLALCVSVLSVKPERGLTAVLVSPSIGGMVARRLIPLAVLTMTILSGVQILVSKTGLFNDESDVIVFTTLTIVAAVSIIWWNTQTIDRGDRLRQQAEHALRISEARYRKLFESSNDAIMISEASGRYLDANSQAECLTGYSHEEILMKWVGSFALQPSEGELLFSQIKDSGNLFRDYVLARKDGTEVSVEFAASAVGEGLYQVIYHDISERKKVEDNLRASLEQERELNELKSRFVSMVSHDFRTPLAVIQSSSDLLLRYTDRMGEEKRKDHLEKIQFQIVRLIQMLDNILIIGKAQQVGWEFKAEPLDVREFCASLVSEFQLAAPAHPILFNSSGSLINIAVDPQLLRQALTNLLSNAVKYSSEHKPVALDLICGENEIVFQVQDQGIGIPEADQKHLFELFHRAQNVGDISGTGIGLSIVKQAVDAHGGSIQVDSRVNAGTTFTIHLPRRQPA